MPVYTVHFLCKWTPSTGHTSILTLTSANRYTYIAILKKVVGKSARDNPERYLGGFEFTVFQRNLREWHERP